MKKVVIAIVVVLLIIISVTAYIQRQRNADLGQYQEEALLDIAWGSGSKTLDMGDILALDAQQFTVTVRSSSAADRDVVYTGVPLKVILAEIGVPLEMSSVITISAIDGYAVALSGEDVLLDDNVYLVYKSDNEWLGTKAQGGSGPYQTVIRQDTFAQRWCKFATQIDVR